MSFAGGTVCVFSTQREHEPANEDAAAVLPFDGSSGILAVADGVGGGRSGGEAARLALEAVAETIENAAQQGLSLRAAVLDGFEAANRRIQRLGTGAATTLAVVEVRGGRIRPYHTGDSTILVTGQRGRVKLQTVDHSPAGFLLEAGVLDETEAIHHEERHLLLNAVGSASMRIEVGTARKMAVRDTLLLASDGLADNLLREEIVDVVRKGSLEDAARVLAIRARSRMRGSAEGQPSKPDDLTFILFRRDPVTQPKLT